MFDSIRLQKIYSKLLVHIQLNENDKDQIAFVDFNEQICLLRQKLTNAFEKDISMI